MLIKLEVCQQIYLSNFKNVIAKKILNFKKYYLPFNNKKKINNKKQYQIFELSC